MLILFINAHKKSEQGRARFNNFYSNIQTILKETIFYGNQISETVRNYDELEDYIYDEISFRTDERVKRKFESLEYIFIDGNISFAPWSENMIDVMLIIRKSIENNKKIICNGFAHFAAYYYLSTHFDKHYIVSTEKNFKRYKKIDYEYQQTTGDLCSKGVKILNSGLQIIDQKRPFADKSSHALHNGIVLASKFDFVVFNSKTGHKIIKNINVPFSFYWKSKLFCTPKSISQAQAQVLYETQLGNPLAYVHKNLISIQGLCTQFLKLVKNWLSEFSLGPSNRYYSNERQKIYQSIPFENQIEYKKALASTGSLLNNTKESKFRPQSSKFSTVKFERPSVRCSGKYQTIDERYLSEQNSKKTFNLGKSKLNFHGNLDEYQIPNYIRKSPSRPASSHKFRQVQKDKWVIGRDFFNC